MKKILLIIVFLMPYLLLHATFGFYGSAVYIETNGSAAFYNCFGNNIGTQSFSGSLGSFTQNSGTLKLQGAELKSWRDSWSNVCEPVFNYRVYSSGSPNGSFNSAGLPWFCNCDNGGFLCGGGSCGGFDQKWQKPGNSGSGINIDLTTYTPGTYTLEVFYRIPGNHNSTSDCPDNLWDNNGGNPTNYTMTFTITAAMPVGLKYFEVNKKNKEIHLFWESATELDNDKFKIEKSFNGQNFELLGIISRKGTANVGAKYEFIDVHPKSGINYYRLTQVDFDGRKETFPPKSIYFESNQRNFDIIPNLAFNNVKVEFEKPVENGRLHIYNIDGQLMQTYILASGIDVLRIDVSELPTGQFIAKYIDGEDIINKKFIKQ